MAVAFTRNGINEGRFLKDEPLRHLPLKNLDANFSFTLIIVFPLQWRLGQDFCLVLLLPTREMFSRYRLGRKIMLYSKLIF